MIDLPYEKGVFMVTLKDVAKEAGLTVTTVSRVLNNRGYISDQARKKVYDAMKTLNYQPNEVARSLSKRSTDTIGLIVPSITHPYFSTLISAIEEKSETKGYKILLFNTKGDINLEEQYMDKCRGSQVAGIVLFSGRDDNQYLKKIDVPVITLERYQEDATASIEVDNYKGGQLAAQALIDAGCRNVLQISAVYETYMPSDDRELGFKDYCQNKEITYNLVRTYADLNVDHNLDELLVQILNENPDVDGIFTGSDLIAMNLIKVCHNHKISVPKDIRIVGYDDIFLSRYVSPTITTIKQPVEEMTELALSLLLKSNKTDIPKKTVLPVELILRQSTNL